jgi:hypothetical protein
LGSQAPGAWGYEHGVNQHGVAAGRAPLHTRLSSGETGLTGPDLVRLVLERARTARQGVDLLTDLVCRHGQAAFPAGDRASDNAFLIADTAEAFTVETGGSHWVCREVRDVGALGGACTIRQDWQRIAPGLAAHAIAAGWWPADGSKLDFAAAVGAGGAAALRRGERATRLLGEQNGRIDTAFVRRLLAPDTPGESAAAGSLIARLSADPRRLSVTWCAFGPPRGSIYVPLFLEGELPAACTRLAPEPPAASAGGRVRRWDRSHDQRQDQETLWRDLDRLQVRLDQEADDFATEGAALRQAGRLADLRRQAGLFMQHCLELFEEVTGAPDAARGTVMPAATGLHP